MVPWVPGQRGSKSLCWRQTGALSVGGGGLQTEVGVREGRAPPWPGPLAGDRLPHGAALPVLANEREKQVTLTQEHLQGFQGLKKSKKPEPPVRLIYSVWNSLQNNCLIYLL